MIEVYLRGTPWAVPFTLVAFVALLLAGRPLARRTGLPQTWWVLAGTSVAGFLGVIATPAQWLPDPAGGSTRHVIWVWELPHTLFSTANQTTLNLWLAVPMAACAAWALVRWRRGWPVAVVALTPPCAEGLQWLFPSFGRVAFHTGDLIANWCGVGLGLALGTVVAGASLRLVPHRPPDAMGT